MDSKYRVEWNTREGPYGARRVPGLANAHSQEDQFAMRAGVIVYSLLLIAMIMTAPAPAFAANIEHGKMLYEQHCTRCHDTRVHTRPDRRIGSLEALQRQVNRCEHNASVNWPQQDVDDVVGYLNDTFYKFGGATEGAEK
jgi:mono/diheme cytochrome c family protein